ncbi:MAG TPA: hypothetical protein ENI80_02325 [Acidiferrobacteraceae bacterium]|nr:hypothetical protein [Acidiferrobacteraceae bacterium]
MLFVAQNAAICSLVRPSQAGDRSDEDQPDSVPASAYPAHQTRQTGGTKVIVTENLSLKHQLLIAQRRHHRSPNLTATMSRRKVTQMDMYKFTEHFQSEVLSHEA